MCHADQKATNLSIVYFLSQGFFISKHLLCLSPFWLVDAFWCIMEVTRVWWEVTLLRILFWSHNAGSNLGSRKLFRLMRQLSKWMGHHVWLRGLGWNTRKTGRWKKKVGRFRPTCIIKTSALFTDFDLHSLEAALYKFLVIQRYWAVV